MYCRKETLGAKLFSDLEVELLFLFLCFLADFILGHTVIETAC